MKFIYQYDDNSKKVEVILPRDSALPEVLEAFEAFLKASGYYFEGQLDIFEPAPTSHE